MIKDLDAHIQFFFLTGVSKFSKVSIFSDLNNLEYLTMSPNCASLLGYTQAEIAFYFGERMKKIAQLQVISEEEL